jgi:hypothetical protein
VEKGTPLFCCILDAAKYDIQLVKLPARKYCCVDKNKINII